MCLEDLKLGRGRQPGTPVSALSGVGAVMAGVDTRRVAVILSFRGVVTFDSGGGVQFNDFAWIWFGSDVNKVPDITLGPGSNAVVLRIEDVGMLITNQITATINNSSGAAQLIVQTVFTNVTAPALGFGAL